MEEGYKMHSPTLIKRTNGEESISEREKRWQVQSVGKNCENLYNEITQGRKDLLSFIINEIEEEEILERADVNLDSFQRGDELKLNTEQSNMEDNEFHKDYSNLHNSTSKSCELREDSNPRYQAFLGSETESEEFLGDGYSEEEEGLLNEKKATKKKQEKGHPMKRSSKYAHLFDLKPGQKRIELEKVAINGKLWLL